MIIAYTKLDATAERRCDSLPTSQLPTEIRRRLSGMRSARARRQTRAGLWLLEQGLTAIGCDPAAIGGLTRTEHGQPTLDGIQFSISHSRSLVACALSSQHITGLDVEYRARALPVHQPRVLAATEHAAIAREPARFFDYWCAREACVKATGRVGLARIAKVELTGGHAYIDGCRWHLSWLRLAGDYASALVTDQAIQQVTTRAYPLANNGKMLSKPDRENTGQHRP